MRVEATTLWRLSVRLAEIQKAGLHHHPLGRTAVREADKANAEYAARLKRRAAVLVPLCLLDGELGVLFTKRSATRVGSHKGHVSFPGGHMDAGETAREAALREYEEEVGLGLGPGLAATAALRPAATPPPPPSPPQLPSSSPWAGATCALGELPPVRAVTGTMVFPVVGVLGQKGGEVLSGAGLQDMGGLLRGPGALAPPCPEVELVFGVSVRELLDPAHRTEEDLGYRGAVPRFQVSTRPPIWGLTAYILDDVLRALTREGDGPGGADGGAGAGGGSGSV